MFLDIGSGIGNMVLASIVSHSRDGTLAEAHGLEVCPVLHGVMVQWLEEIKRHSPFVNYAVEVVKSRVMLADFSVPDRSVDALLGHCDVIFCNNYLFGECPGEQPSETSLLNRKLHDLLCRTVGTTTSIVTTRSLMMDGSRRDENSRLRIRARAHVGKVVQHHSWQFDTRHVGWGGNLTGKISSIVH